MQKSVQKLLTYIYMYVYGYMSFRHKINHVLPCPCTMVGILKLFLFSLQDGFRFDDNLVDDRGKVEGNLDYQPRTDPFNETSEIVKTQISRLTSK